MKSKFWISLIVSSLFVLNPLAVASEVDPAQELTLVDQFMQLRAGHVPMDMCAADGRKVEPAKEQKENQDSRLFNSLGQSACLAQAISAQLLSLSPTDFNLFLFHFMDRYIHRPKERKDLADFLQIVRQMIEPDLKNTAALKLGPWDDISRGTYTWGIGALLAGSIAWAVIMKNPSRLAAFLQAVASRGTQLAAAGGKVTAYGYRMAVNRWTMSAAAGGLVGLALHEKEVFASHRLDPDMLLKITQANLACQLSYQTLQFEQTVNKTAENNQELTKQGPAFKKQAAELLEQIKLLQDQFPWLTSLHVGDPMFQKILSDYPRSSNWQEYKQGLNSATDPKDGTCIQIGLEHVTKELNEIKSELEAVLPDAPAQGAQP